MDKTELLNKLYDISDGVEKIVACQTRQVSLVNEMREEKLEHVEKYDDNNISHNMLKVIFFVIAFGVVFEVFGGSIRALSLGFSSLLTDLILIGICIIAVSFLLYKSMHNKDNKRLYQASILFAVLLMYWPIRLLLSGNLFTFILAIISAIAARFISQKYLSFWVKLVNGEIGSQNASYKQAYDVAVSHNARLQQLYDEESNNINQYVSEVTKIGQGWYPKDYYTLHAVKYFIHCLENYKADTVKEMVQLYDTYVDRKQRRSYEQEMVSLQEEQLINQDRMIELLEYSNALEMTHIALTADIARTNETIASNLTGVNQSVNTIKNQR